MQMIRKLHWLVHRPLAALVIVLLVFPGLASAADESFIGLGAGVHRLHFDSDDRNALDVNREDEIAAHVRVGLIRPDNRLYGQWTIIPANDYFVTSLTVNADYLLRMTPQVLLFGGVGAGAVSLSWNGDNAQDTMPALTLQAGVIVEITPRVEVELGVRQLFTRLRTEPQGADGEAVNVDLDRMGMATAGVNVRF
ncbi:outer membrane beta-barrel protein [Aquisalimonas sp.]|uniref:outer membrane protein n=1 Tax=Aquisalimonas sp. TaxID=1872621 RepID=UPI0025BED5EA|nr:outer membrane beta-barrel protein [Aquisalimonas sp.]